MTKKILKIFLWTVLTIFLIFTITFFYLIGVLFHPAIDKPNNGQLEKEMLFTGCYEGTQSQAIINFRTDSTFDMNITAAFGFDKWWQGWWSQKSDTVKLLYEKEIEEIMGDSFKRTDYELIPFPKKHNRVFSIGPCKHRN
ncbi:MAG: hypothetical protein V4683_15555 [Bacteroidota bacterium]